MQVLQLHAKALQKFRNVGDIDGETAAQTLIAQVGTSTELQKVFVCRIPNSAQHLYIAILMSLRCSSVGDHGKRQSGVNYNLDRKIIGHVECHNCFDSQTCVHKSVSHSTWKIAEGLPRMHSDRSNWQIPLMLKKLWPFGSI